MVLAGGGWYWSWSCKLLLDVLALVVKPFGVVVLADYLLALVSLFTVLTPHTHVILTCFLICALCV